MLSCGLASLVQHILHIICLPRLERRANLKDLCAVLIDKKKGQTGNARYNMPHSCPVMSSMSFEVTAITSLATCWSISGPAMAMKTECVCSWGSNIKVQEQTTTTQNRTRTRTEHTNTTNTHPNKTDDTQFPDSAMAGSRHQPEFPELGRAWQRQCIHRSNSCHVAEAGITLTAAK